MSNRLPPMHLKSASMRTRGISHWTHKVSDNRGKNVKRKSFTHPSQFTLILLKHMGNSPVKEALKSNRHPATHIKSTPLKHFSWFQRKMHRSSQLHSWRPYTNKQFNCAPPLYDLLWRHQSRVKYQSSISQVSVKYQQTSIKNDPEGICQ